MMMIMMRSYDEDEHVDHDDDDNCKDHGDDDYDDDGSYDKEDEDAVWDQCWEADSRTLVSAPGDLTPWAAEEEPKKTKIAMKSFINSLLFTS